MTERRMLVGQKNFRAMERMLHEIYSFGVHSLNKPAPKQDMTLLRRMGRRR